MQAAGSSPPGPKPYKWEWRYKWAGLISLGFAAVGVLLTGFALAFPGGKYSSCSTEYSNRGILAEISPAEQFAAESITLDTSEIRWFPPGRVCRAYAYFPNSAGYSGDESRLAAEKVYPTPASYLWLIALIVSPFAVIWVHRNWHRLRARAR